MLKFLISLKSEAAVGLFIIAGAGALVFSSIQVTGWKSDTQEVYTVSTLLDNVTGLASGTAVRIAGIKVGEVEDIELENGKARVYLTIYRKYPLHRDSQISVKSLGILGDKYIELTPGNPNFGMINDNGEIILVEKGSDLDSMIDSLATILNDFQEVTYALSKSFGGDKGAEKFDLILENVIQLTSSLDQAMAKTNARIDRILESIDGFTMDLSNITSENQQDIRLMIMNLNKFSADLKEMSVSLKDDVPVITGNLRELMENNRERLDNIIRRIESITVTLDTDVPEVTKSLKKSLTKFEGTAEKLDNSMAHVESITEKIDHGQGTIGKLVNDEATVEKLNQALDDLGGFLGDAQKLKINLDFHTNYLTSDENFKSYLGVEVFPYRDHSLLIQVVDDPNGVSKTETIETVTQNDDGTSSTLREEETTYTDSYKLSLMLTQRFFDTRVRAGIFENTFGVGLDQLFGFNDTYWTSFEAFDFGNPTENIHYKMDASWRFHSNFYLTLGADDIANRDPTRRNFFVGFGLGFNEDSLKTLATVAGGASALTP